MNLAPYAVRLVLLACILSLPAWAKAEAPDAKQVMRDIQTQYGSVQSLAAEFEQHVGNAAFGQAFSARGRIRYAGGKIRWDYDAPDPQTYVVAGSSVYWVQPAERQIVKMKLDQAFETHHAVAALLGGMHELDKYFSPLAANRLGQQWHLQLKPKFENAQVVDVEIVYDSKQKTVVAVTIADAMGNNNRIELKAVRKGAKIPAGVFDVETLPGYRLANF